MNLKRVVAVIGVFLLFITNASAAYAAVLILDPGSASTPIDKTFTVEFKIDTGGEQVTSSDAVMKYNSAILTVESIKEGGDTEAAFFPELYPSVTNDEIFIGAAVQDSIDTREGSGTVATITFKGKVSGISEVVFDCTAGKTSDTNISKSDKNATDIVDCTRLNRGIYTVGSGIGAPPTPTPGGPTATPTPTIPVSGSTEATASIIAVGTLLTLGGIAARFLLKA